MMPLPPSNLIDEALRLVYQLRYEERELAPCPDEYPQYLRVCHALDRAETRFERRVRRGLEVAA